MSLRILTASDVARITSSTNVQDALNLMALVFHRLSSGMNERHDSRDDVPDIAMPHRISVPTAKHSVLCMPARISPFGTALKVVSVPRSSEDVRGLPASTLVLDEDTGAVRAMINARALTAFRTAAGSALATQLLLGPNARPRRLLAVGAGAQVEAHVSLLLSLYPSLDAVCIANRSANPRAQATIESLARFATVQFTLTTLNSDLRSHIEAADIIVMATSSKVPLLGANEKHIPKGAHIILVGSYTPDMHEVSSNLLERARTSGNGIRSIVVDSRSACLKEAGELISGGVEADEVTEIGELLHESSGAGYIMHEERCTHLRKAGEVTIFKSVGVGVQDVAIATHIFRKADEMGLGVQVFDYDK